MIRTKVDPARNVFWILIGNIVLAILAVAILPTSLAIAITVFSVTLGLCTIVMGIMMQPDWENGLWQFVIWCLSLGELIWAGMYLHIFPKILPW